MTPINYGLFLLSRRDYSVAELRAKCQAHYAGDPAMLAEIEPLIERLLELDYLNDQRFVESFLRRESQRGQGPAKVRWTLQQKGVANSLIGQAIESIDWFQVCRDTLSERAHRFDLTDTNKIYRFLASRGFSGDHIQDSLSNLRKNNIDE